MKASKTAWVRNNIVTFDLENIGDLKGKTLFITGCSRGIGLAIALRAAEDGANVAVVAKTVKEHPKLPGTIYTAAAEIEKAGGKAIAIQTDIRSEESVQAAVDKCVEAFGGIDILVNNASAISLTNTPSTEMKRYDLIHSVNTRGTYLCSKLCLPHLMKAKNPHILNISPPLEIFEHGTNWFAPHVAYTMAKYGMTLCAYGMAEEFKQHGIAVNTLWPRTAIATAAVQNLLGGDSSIKMSRKPEIMADAAWEILTCDSKIITGKFFMDDEILISKGAMELSGYACVEGTKDEDLMPDYFC